MLSPRYGLSTRLTKRNCGRLFHHVLFNMGDGRPAFGPTCTEFVYPECRHFDYDATSKIDGWGVVGWGVVVWWWDVIVWWLGGVWWWAVVGWYVQGFSLGL